MRPTFIENARITGVTLGIEDHGILTINIQCESASGTQSFGGYALDGKPGSDRNRAPSALCGAWVAGILRALGVDAWEKLRGQVIRIEREQSYGPITRIGHIIDDRWFSPDAALAQSKESQS